MQVGILVVLPLFVVALSPQGTPVPGAGAAIPPVVWELVELTTDDSGPGAIAEPSRYTVQFLPDGMVAIGADCNRVAGTYAIDGTSLRITLKASTLALCPADSQAEPYLGALQAAASFAFANDGHLVIDGKQGTLRFRPSLPGVTWEWQDFRGGNDEVIAPRNPGRYTLSFLPDGRLAIKADCNRAMGTYTVTGARIELKIGGVTRVKCPPGSLMNEYLRDLAEVTSHVFRDGQLYLALPLDAGIMAFAPRSIEPGTATPVSG